MKFREVLSTVVVLITADCTVLGAGDINAELRMLGGLSCVPGTSILVSTIYYLPYYLLSIPSDVATLIAKYLPARYSAAATAHLRNLAGSG